jgi:hypothetical protein
MPSQVSCTTTEKTPYRKHWGRNYWPYPSAQFVSSSGHIASALVTNFLGQVHYFYDLLQKAELFPVIPVTQIDGAPARALLGVTEVQMDDVFDVQRRRRLKNPTLRVDADANGVRELHRAVQF